MTNYPFTQSSLPATAPRARRSGLPVLLAASAVLLWPVCGQSAPAADRKHPAPARPLDLALLVADVPLSRPFALPSPRPTLAVDTTAATAPAASAALFAAAPVTTPAGLPSVPVAATPAPLSPTLPTATSLPTATTAAPPPVTAAPGGILLNFKNASLADVLNYLSAAAGFVILQEQPVTGTVDIVSRQPINADEAVDLLNTVLIEKGFVALRSGRILKIVPRANAEKRDLPVVKGADPTLIPRNDNMVTQILPVRYAEVAKLVDSLRPLVSDGATITSNDSSNAILLTDTQANIHRIAEIVRALDTSISSISTLRVFPLRFGDSKALADLITQLFSPTGTSSNNQGRGNNNQQPGGFPGAPNFGGNFGGRNRGNGAPAQPESEARQAASRVVAVADEQSNSIVVAAPDEYMPTISEVISRLDTNVSDVSETRIFHLLYADATELANTLTTLYPDTSNSTPGGGNNGRNGGQNGPPNIAGQFAQFLQRQNDGRSERALLQARVAAVADARTNSVLVNASRVTMEQIALTVARLDATDVQKQHVYVHTLAHADPDNVALILRGMFTSSNSGSSTSSSAQAMQPSTSRLEQRTTQGATSSITNTLNTNSSSTTGR